MASQSRESKSDIALALLTERLDNLIEKVESLEREVKDLSDTANRWKGGFLLLFTLGGVLGYLSTFLSNMWKVFHGS